MKKEDSRKRKQSKKSQKRNKDKHLYEDTVNVKLTKVDDTIPVSLKLFRIASKNVSRDFLRRWWCDHYNLPPTDSRLGIYTMDELMVEWLENMIDKEAFEVDVNGDPAIVTIDEDGVEELETGDEEFDEDMRWLAEERRKTIRSMKVRDLKDKSTEEGKNVLENLAKLAKRKREEDAG